MPKARPYNDKDATAVCDAIASSRYGIRRVVAANPHLPSVTTIMRWLDDPENVKFREQYARATDLRADLLAEECLDISDESEHDGERVSDHEDVHATEQVARSKLRVDTRKWLAGKLRPKKYGDTLKVAGDENGAPIKHAVVVEFIGDD